LENHLRANADGGELCAWGVAQWGFSPSRRRILFSHPGSKLIEETREAQKGEAGNFRSRPGEKHHAFDEDIEPSLGRKHFPRNVGRRIRQPG
jgi:hypothetical protein